MPFRDGALTWASNESFLYTASFWLLLDLGGFSGLFTENCVDLADAAGDNVSFTSMFVYAGSHQLLENLVCFRIAIPSS